MSKPSREAAPNRRSHDRADRQARQRRVAAAAVAAVSLVVLLTGYWWYSRRDLARDGAPSWFPDSRALVFSAEVGAGRADIFRMNADGTGRERLIADPANDSAPAVSPDGSLIAFESDRDGNYEIYVAGVDGRSPRRLTHNPARDQAPAWSPDGRRIVFTSDRDHRAGADVYVMNADGTGVERLTSDLAHWAPQFSPDGGRIAVQVNRDVQVIDLADGTSRRLTDDPRNGMNPTWAPDGQRIAFVTTRNGQAEIFTMNADGTDQTRLVTMARGNAIDPRWSPDGARIAFVLVPDAPAATSSRPSAEDLQAIYTVEVASGIVTRLSR